MADLPIVDLSENANPLAAMSPAELHGEGLEYLVRARQEFTGAPSAAAAASVAIACFFAAMSADSLGTETGAHRADSGEHPVASLTGRHG